MLLTPPTCRAADDRDWLAIAALLDAAALPRAGAREHLTTFVVAERDGQLLGTAGLEIYGDTALLRSVVVTADARRAGIARRLVEYLVQAAATHGITALYLLTTTAAGFFARLDFTRVPRASAPLALQASAEFQGACPASAELMCRRLKPAVAREISAFTTEPTKPTKPILSACKAPLESPRKA